MTEEFNEKEESVFQAINDKKDDAQLSYFNDLLEEAETKPTLVLSELSREDFDAYLRGEYDTYGATIVCVSGLSDEDMARVFDKMC